MDEVSERVAKDFRERTKAISVLRLTLREMVEILLDIPSPRCEFMIDALDEF